ncbi:M24 family metallopeptidase [Desulfonatronovibrio magnus]|uniref:M24 family metallopeptidase n=1 Tax=Desulfonatronovibrio magnus TaxID=698827 RepID=UPI0005EADEE8|nr:Xaa-Pro peptidase family protein [Desulfonatronovibrio magnus]
MNLSKYQHRIQQLQSMMSQNGVDFFLIQSPANRFYLSGFELFDPQCNESSGYLIISKDKTYLLTDPRYQDTAKQHSSINEIFIYSADKFKKINEFLKKIGVKSLAFEPQWMKFDFFQSLSREFDLKPVQNLVESLRMIKDAEEIRLIEKSCQLNHHVFRLLEKIIEPGISETEVAWRAEKYFREHGASGLSFSTIVAAGKNAAQPHAIPRNRPIPEETPLLIDMGCRLDDYCSDQTRTFWVGSTPTRKFMEVKDLVMEAQNIAIMEIGPGMPIREAYFLARSFFEKHKVHEHFTHALGHGIGLETHEPPSVGPRTTGTFKAGMIISVEPGLYYPDWGGVRWEYMVLITDNGARIL